MKTVGIIGGLSPESTILYYQGINEGVRARLGGNHNARIILNSLDFGEFIALKEQGNWETQSKLLCSAAKSLEHAGANFIILATNTMHKMADNIEGSINIPFLHLADSTAHKIKSKKLDKIALLGTKYTMEQDFYKCRLENQNIEVITPNKSSRDIIHNIIYDELCHGIINPKSKDAYLEIISDMAQEGAQGVILGCTEITMLIKPEDINIETFDTTAIHIKDSLDYIFQD